MNDAGLPGPDEADRTLPPSTPWRRAWERLLRPVVVCILSVAAAVLTSSLLAAGIAAALGTPLPPARDGRLPAPTFIAFAWATDVGLLCVGALLLAFSRGTLKLAFPARAARPALVGLFGVGAINGIGSGAMYRFHEAYSGLPLVSGRLEWLAVVAIAGALAPLCEEIFFREAILIRVLGDTPPAVAIVVSSAAFALLHVYSGGPVLVVTLFGMGLILAWLRRRTGSLGPPVAVHALNNLLAMWVS